MHILINELCTKCFSNNNSRRINTFLKTKDMEYKAFQASLAVSNKFFRALHGPYLEISQLHFDIPGYPWQGLWMATASKIQFLY